MVIFGILGFVLRKVGFEAAPFLLALVLGPIMETSLRQSLIISRGSFTIFLIRPISGLLIILALIFLLTPTITAVRKKRELSGAAHHTEFRKLFGKWNKGD